MVSEETAIVEDPIIFSRANKATEIPAHGLTGTIEATAQEHAAIAEILDLVELKSLDVKFQLTCAGLRRFELAGRVTAAVVQNCVITLEPVENSIDEELAIAFWPAADVARLESGDEPEDTEVPHDGPEPLPENGLIDVGQAAYELLASTLDPYPRKPGVQFAGQKDDSEQSEQEGNKPFANLDVMLRRKDTSVR